MSRIFSFLLLLLPLGCLSQINLSGRIIDHDAKPVASASVFLSNATIGSKTANDGSFTLHNLKPGKYDLVVSMIGFEKYSQEILVNNLNIRLGDIIIIPKEIILSQVIIKPDPNRERNYEWFKDGFLGTSEMAKACKILNPDVLDLVYDDETNTLTASSYDYLQIENSALGYKINYLLGDFSMVKDNEGRNIHYKGSVFFEEMKGRPSEQRRWQTQRNEVYKNSLMHFLRAAVNNRIDEEGFSVQRLATHSNPNRPADSLINAKIKLYKKLKAGKTNYSDSLSYWIKKSKLPKGNQKLMPYFLSKNEIINTTGQQDQFALGCNMDALYISYNPDHHFHLNAHLDYLYNDNNAENTIVNFNSPFAFFYKNGVIANPYSIFFFGAWGKKGVAELLPIDYEGPQPLYEPIETTAVTNTISKLKEFSTAHITEKASLHFDKPYYAAGDTLYFKAYLTLGEKHQPSNLSGVLHVDLVNTSNKIDQSLKLQVTNGVAWGDFALPDSLPAGNYRVRAYTQWMRNDGEGAFFDQVIPVGSSLNNKIPESGPRNRASINAKPDTRFFPEGGSLVTGIRSKVAFKAIDRNGLGIPVKGMIVDDEGKEVCPFESAHLGMGYFYITPAAGRAYQAKITYPDGTQDITTLQKAGEKGITLSVNNDSIPAASVRITANNAYYLENRDKTYLLVIYSGGIATTVFCKLDSAVVTLTILKRRLHTGIATVTLFSPTNEPLAERLLFVQNYDQLSLDLKTGKQVYAKREKVNISVDAMTRAGTTAEGHFSVSVTDESKVPVDENAENTILTNLLLTSDLKGYVEQPNYYFTGETAKTRAGLDLVMLTHGYRRFEWKPLLNNEYPPIAYQPESGLEISGQVKNMFGGTIAKGTVTLVPTKGGPLLSSVSDEKGLFRFSNLVFDDTTHFVLSAVNKKGSNYTRITYFEDKPGPLVSPRQLIQKQEDTAMAVYIENVKKERNEFVNYGRGKGIMLKEVKIRDIRKRDDYRTQSLAGAGHADQVMHADEIEKVGGQLSTSLSGRLRGVTFIKGVPVLTQFSAYNMHPMLVIVDGAEMGSDPPFDINMIPSSSVETVEVLKYASTSIYGVAGGDGVLIITTKQGGRDIKDVASIGILPITPPGFYKAREFYSPKYSHSDFTGKQRDLRATIYWKPELVTDKDGHASFEYYNADGAGDYRVVIEGIDDNGNLGRQVFRYKVE